MSADRGPLREVAWTDVFPWLSIFRAVRIALQVRLLFLSAAGLLFMTLGWSVLAWVFSGTDEPLLSEWTEAWSYKPWDGGRGVLTHESLSGGPPAIHSAGRSFEDGPLVQVWWNLSAPFRLIFNSETTFTSLAFLLLCALWAAAVWALFGGAITRIAAVQLARDQRISLREGLSFAWSKWLSYFAAPLFPLIGLFMSSLPLLVAGWLMRLDFGLLLVSLGWPLAILSGILMAILAVGLLVGWPLMLPTISTEGLDSFDALNHSYSYVFQRPLHLLFYVVLAALLAFLAGVVVMFFADLVLYLPAWASSWGSGELNAALGISAPTEERNSMGRAGLAVMDFWRRCVLLIAIGSFYSFFWTSATAIYFRLRKDTDGTEDHEIYLEESVEPLLPAALDDVADEELAPTAADGEPSPSATGAGPNGGPAGEPTTPEVS